LEDGWWILASTDLTRRPSLAKATKGQPEPAVEYSAREVAPTPLLIAQLLQAHSVFLLHHAGSLGDLLSRLGRPAFTSILDRYWTKFARNWDVLLHGNPAADVFNATKLAGGGEIGVGVGEEEWGSGEREVLEDFVQRTEGLVDLVVGRYGNSPDDSTNSAAMLPGTESARGPWLGNGDASRAADGIVFSGVGALSRRSLATVSQWMEAIFRHGESAYGVGENPSSRPRPRRRRRGPGKVDLQSGLRPVAKEEPHPKVRSPYSKPPDLRRSAMENAATPPGIPAPLVNSVERSLLDATKGAERRSPQSAAAQNSQEEQSSYFDTDTMLKYLKLGYGSSWTINPKGFSSTKDESSLPESGAGDGDDSSKEDTQKPLEQLDPQPETSDDEDRSNEPFVQRLEQSIGRFLIGLSGDLENTEFEADDTENGETQPRQSPQRVFMRTLVVQLLDRRRSRSPAKLATTLDPYDKVQVAVYIHQPFIFVFLFGLQTPSLTMPGFYRSIHHQLGPLQKPLLRSTDPRRIPERLAEAVGESADQLGASGIYDLVFDPSKLTVRTSIPNIPLPGTLAAEGILASTRASGSTTASRIVSGSWYTLGIPIGPSTPVSQYDSKDGTKVTKSDWTRIESLNVHTQVLNTFMATRSGQAGSGEIERTVKTSRGWWVVWMRVPMSLAMRAPTPALSPSRSRSSLGAEVSHGQQARPARGGENEAFLIRKAVETSKTNSQRERSGRWLLRDGREVSGNSTGSAAGATTSARGVVEGVGVDARRWIEGLVKLSS
jgi:hypothetical protein